jgi:hypothetical protein
MSQHRWLDLIPRKWMLWACEEDEVHHLVSDGEQFFWVNFKDIKDYRDVVVFDSRKETREYIKQIITNGFYPDKVGLIQYAMVVPSYDKDTKTFWAEEVLAIYDVKVPKVVFKGKKKVKK